MKIELLEGLNLELGSPVHVHSSVWAGSTGKDKALGEGGTKEGSIDRESGPGIGPSWLPWWLRR